MATKRQYTEQEKAVALAAHAACGDVSKAARMCKIPRTTLIHWIAGEGTNAEVSKIGQIKKGEIADRLEDLVHILIDAIPGKIEDAQMQAVTTSIGIAVDKMQLLRGKATSITDDASLTDVARVERISTLFDLARARRGLPAPPALNGAGVLSE